MLNGEVVIDTFSNISNVSTKSIKSNETNTEKKFIRHQPSKTMDKTDNSVLSKYKYNEIAKNRNGIKNF